MMTSMSDAFDLAHFVVPDEPYEWQPVPVDVSGRPNPVNVRVQLNSGVVVKCDCRYQGVNPKDGCRLFTVIAEIDWENYHPKLLIVEEYPNDVEFRFRVPGMSNEDGEKLAATMQFIPERIIRV